MLAKMGGRRPPFVLLENVLGLIHSNGGYDFETCLRRLADAGYLVDSVVVDARHFVPQSRPRLFVIGVRREIDVGPTVTSHQIDVNALRPKRLVKFIRNHAHIPWNIRPMPDLPTAAKMLEGVLEGLPANDPAWWSADRVERLKAQVSARHLSTVAALLRTKGRVVATAFRRMRRNKSMAELRFDGIAGCLRTPKGGSAKQILVVVNRKGWRARLLSARECARLMGADSFRMDAEGISNDDALFGFGDAVCVPAVEWLVRNYVNPIAAEVIRGRFLRQ
jgi:DNA (cytosine-5)-methyltransferase 1